MKNRVRSRLALLSAFVFVCGAALVHALTTATIQTDFPDYYPGDTVVITGAGWEPGETVRLSITQDSPPISDPTTVFDTIADASGGVYNTDFRIQESHLGATFTLVAVGLTSGQVAEWKFTDSPNLTTATLSAQSPNPVLSGNQANFDFTVNRSATARNFNVNLTVTGLPTGVTFNFNPGSINFGGGSGSRTVNLVLTTSSSVPTGAYPFTATATVATNSSDTASASGVLNVLNDAIAPTTTATPTIAPNANGWNKTSLSVNLSATDNAGGSGVKELIYSATGAQTIASTTVAGSTASVLFNVDGVTTFTYQARDNAGNLETAKTLTIRIDRQAPVITEGATTGTAGNNGWYRSDVSVAYTAADATSGLETPADAAFSLSTIGEGLSVSTGSRVIRDLAGNESTAGPKSFKVDMTPPALTQGATSGTAGDNGWYLSDVSVAFTASDATSGLANAADGAFNLSANGEGASVATDSRTVFDAAGNSSTAGPLSFMIDQTPPVLIEGSTTGTPGLNGWYWSPVSVDWSASDAISGLRDAGDAAFTSSTTGEGSGISTGSRTVYDMAGNSASTTAHSFDVDLTDPLITPMPDRPANSFGWYTAPVLVTFNATDAASGVATVTDPTTYAGPDSDSASVPAQATDNSGRTSSTSFTLKYDSTAPALLVTGIDTDCMRVADINASATDLFLDWAVARLNLPGGGFDQRALPASYHVEVEGPYTLQVRAVDQAGNETLQSFDFHIDLSAPVILFGAGWPSEGVYYNSDRTLEFDLEDPEDSFTFRRLTRSIASGNLIINLLSGHVESDEGRFLVELTAVDCAGNEASASRTFYIDKTPPNVAITPIGTPGNNGWFVGPSLSVQLTSTDPLIRAPAGSLDEISGSGVSNITYAASGASPTGLTTDALAVQTLGFTEGISMVELGSSDAAGNASSVATMEIKYDNTPPTIEAISDVTVEATGPDGAAVDLPSANASDNLTTAAVNFSHADGSTFPLGETTVTVTAEDEAGLQSQITFKVIVRDTTAPTFDSSPADVTVEATGPDGAIATFTLPTASDLVDLAPTVSADRLSGETFPLGETTITVTARDFTGNESTTSFKVKVVDTTPPALTLPADLEVEGNTLGGATVTFLATSLDIVDGAVTVNCTPASGSHFPLGETTVNCSATDAAGNTANGSFKLKVVDTTPPTFAGVPANIVAEATGPSGASVAFGLPTVHDIVSGSVSVSSSHTSGATFPLGSTTVTFTTQDGTGNQATATFTVTVVDTTAPVLSLPANIAQIAASASGNVVTFTATSNDLVSGSVAVVCTPASGSLFPLGTTTVSCTATDAAGNVAAGSFTVTISYAWSNVLSPIKTDGSSMFKLGSTVPVKFKLTGASAGITDAVARLYLTKVDDNPSGTETPADSTSAATTGNLFRYDPTSDQYIFNLGTKGLSTGRWRLRIDLGDGVLRTVEISLR